MTKEEFIKKWANDNSDFKKELELVLMDEKVVLPDTFMKIDEIYDAWSEPKSDYDLGVRSGIEITWNALKKYFKK